VARADLNNMEGSVRMTAKAIALLTGVLLLIGTCCLGAAVIGAGGVAIAACANPAPSLTGAAPASPPAAPAGGWPAVGQWTSSQVGNAAIIVAVGQQLHVPPRGWVIAVAVAMQESSLTNTPGGDQDSVGLFQQRPSQGWGTPAQLMDPVYASTKFYTALLKVPHWQDLPLTVAAQAVQRSAFPDAYAKHEPDALAIVSEVSGVAQAALAACGAAGPWTQPVHGPIVSGFRTPQRPTHQGDDLAAPPGTTIVAASAGTITVVTCQAIAPDGSNYGCDRDGSPDIKGCGWYVEIQHGAGIMTRYCHMKTRPIVAVGQPVAPGEPIGLVGTSGNSSGPHLHFEVHLNNDRSSNGAVDPEPFMREHGAPLGQ
jgi:murein DD-endopeptidase MepM/ murein hydrolase activator NlpD